MIVRCRRNVIVAVNIEKYQFGEIFEIVGCKLQKFDSVAKLDLYYFID